MTSNLWRLMFTHFKLTDDTVQLTLQFADLLTPLLCSCFSTAWFLT